MKCILPLAFFLMLIGACSGNGRRLESFRWNAVSPPVDSITIKLEYDFANYEPTAQLAGDVASLRKACAGSRAHAARIAFWECRLKQRLMDTDGAYAAIKYADSIADSVANPYEFYRIRGILRQFSRLNGATTYRQLDEELRFYQSVNDRPMTAVAYINLATNLYHIGEYERSLEYMNLANDINRELGFGKIVSKNTINIANIEFTRGNDRKGREILLGLLEDDNIRDDSSAINLIKRNMYAHTGDVQWLFSAYEGVKNDSLRRDLRGLYTALLSRYYFDSERPDSGSYYSRKAFSELPYVDDYDHRAMVLDVYASELEITGKVDSALYYRKLMEAYVDSAAAQIQREDVQRMSNMREVQMAIAAERERSQRMKLNYLGVIFLVLFVAALVSFLFYRRYQSGQIARRDSQLELEKGRRHLLALTLAMEEKNNTFQSIVGEIDRMRKEGTIDSGEASAVQNIIKMHLAGAEERDSFRRMFITVNPDFVQRLQQRWPDLSENYVKLATYIYLGLDNSQIARLLVIRPESVKQARWRLRKMLGLEKDESLDEVIRSLGS